MAEPTWKLYVRDAGLNRVAELDGYISFAAKLRYNDLSAWTLSIGADQPGADLLGAIDGASGIVLTRDGTVVLSGPTRRVLRSEGEDGSVIDCSGADDTLLLWRRYASPVPSGPPYTAAAEDVRTGTASTIMRQYVDANTGPSAVAARKVADLTLAADPLAGGSATGRGRFQKLIDLLREIAGGPGLRFWVEQVGAGRQFKVEVPRDLTARVIFAKELGNLSDISREEVEPAANYLVAGGAGEGTARTFDEDGDTSSIATYGRIEDFLDKRNAATAELEQDIGEALSDKAEQIGWGFTPLETEHSRFMEDYRIGDRVTVVLGGVPETAYVTQVDLKVTRQGGGAPSMAVAPTLTTTPNAPNRTREIRALADRVGHLETAAEGYTAGMVIMWDGALGSIPSGWDYCDGSNGTRNLRGRFVISTNTDIALGALGGAATLNFQHNHTGPSHTHPIGHTHPSGDYGGASFVLTDVNNGGSYGVAHRDHKHFDINTPSLTSGSGGTGTTGNGLANNTSILPPYIALHYIKRRAA